MGDSIEKADRPAISVVIAVRNGEATIAQQLSAILNQRVQDEFEVIIVDNGSTDATSSVVGAFASKTGRVRLLGGIGMPANPSRAKISVFIMRRARRLLSVMPMM